MPAKITASGPAGDAARAYQLGIPNLLRKWKVEGAPGAYAQVRKMLRLKIFSYWAPQTVEAYNALGARDRFPRVGRSAEWESAERYRREPQTFCIVPA
jgi:hypothetical protein